MARAVLAAALLVTGATAAEAQLKPSSAEEIGAAVQACAAATTADSVSEQALIEAGWSKGSFLKDGKQVEAQLDVFGKQGSNPIIMTDTAVSKSAGKLCLVLAGLKRPRDYQGVVDMIDSLDTTTPVKKEGLTISFSNGKQIIQSSLTGSQDAPSVRIAVMANRRGEEVNHGTAATPVPLKEYR